MGGLWSVTLTDFVQVFLIVIGMIIAVPFAMNYAGGWDNVASNIPEGTLSLFQGYDLFGIISLVIMYTATFSVGQEAVSRFYAQGRKGSQGRRMAGSPGKLYLRLYPHDPGIITPGPNQYGQVQLRAVCQWARVTPCRSWPSTPCRLLSADCCSQASSPPPCPAPTPTFLRRRLHFRQ